VRVKADTGAGAKSGTARLKAIDRATVVHVAIHATGIAAGLRAWLRYVPGRVPELT
jgi:hypothetical protein